MIEAKECFYSGYYLRSILEARTAVFLDKLDIKWEYEPKVLTVSDRLESEVIPKHRSNSRSWNYIPDFWLPDHKVFIEVKGSLDNQSLWKLLNTVAHISSSGEYGCNFRGSNDGYDVVIFGKGIFDPNVVWKAPIILHMCDGWLTNNIWPGKPQCQYNKTGCLDEFSGKRFDSNILTLDGLGRSDKGLLTADFLGTNWESRGLSGQELIRTYGLVRNEYEILSYILGGDVIGKVPHWFENALAGAISKKFELRSRPVEAKFRTNYRTE